MTAPVLQALLVADHIYQDQTTGKFVICGIFGTIFFVPNEYPQPEPPTVPPAVAPGAGAAPLTGEVRGSGPDATDPNSRQPSLNQYIRAGSPYAYVSLTEIRGQKSFQMRYVDLKENHTIFAFEFKVDCRNPLETVQLTMPLPSLPVAPDGAFALELVCEGEILGSHRILTRVQRHD
ncbi:MAG: hypothetical protein JSS49_05485 [Planctomycetes bacterium]|nr:hypothetical protein [Planctomycetota bacterium]